MTVPEIGLPLATRVSVLGWFKSWTFANDPPCKGGMLRGTVDSLVVCFRLLLLAFCGSGVSVLSARVCVTSVCLLGVVSSCLLPLPTLLLRGLAKEEDEEEENEAAEDEDAGGTVVFVMDACACVDTT